MKFYRNTLCGLIECPLELVTSKLKSHVCKRLRKSSHDFLNELLFIVENYLQQHKSHTHNLCISLSLTFKMQSKINMLSLKPFGRLNHIQKTFFCLNNVLSLVIPVVAIRFLFKKKAEISIHLLLIQRMLFAVQTKISIHLNCFIKNVFFLYLTLCIHILGLGRWWKAIVLGIIKLYIPTRNFYIIII